MADDERRRRRRSRMDLDLYLGLPRSPRRPSLDLGSDLSLSSLPHHLSSTTTTSEDTDMYSSNPHAPYSPSHAIFTPNPNLPPPPPPPPQPASAADGDDPHHQEQHAYFPSPMIPVPGFAPISSPDDNSDGPIEIDDDPDSPPPPPPPHATTGTTSSYVSRSPYYLPPRSWSYIPLDPRETDDPISIHPLTQSYHQRLLDISPAYAPPPSPPYSPPSPSYVRSTPTTTEWSGGRDDRSSSHWDRLESPEFRFRRLIESNHRWRVRRFRSSLPYARTGRLGFARASSPEPEQLMMDIMRSQRSLERNGKHKVHAGTTASESLEEGKEEASKSAANFECNICLDMAEDPVVTSCGHLFCWPCLYQWLHVHSEHKECPVCKGEVTECNITPIYGRGSSCAGDGKKLADNAELGLNIPPRPSGNRLESFRQQFHPIPRRFTEGMVTSWRQSMNIRIRNRNRLEAHREASVPGLTGEQIALLNRVRADDREVLENVHGAEDFRIPRESNVVPQSSIAGSHTGGQAAFGNRTRAGFMGGDLRAEPGPEAEDTRMLRENTAVPIAPHFRGGIGLRRQQSFYDLAALDGVATVGADTGRGIGSSSRYGVSTSSLDRWIHEQWYSVPSTSATDQASGSSTAAMIRGDVGHPDGSVEPNSR